LGASDNVLRGLTASRNFFGIALDVDSQYNHSSGNLIENNLATLNAGRGISLNDPGSNNRVLGNTVASNRSELDGSAIYLHGFADGTAIERNRIADNIFGIFLSDSFGQTLIARNILTGNDVGIDLLESEHTWIRKNQVSFSGGDGTYTPDGDGIHVDDVENVISENVTERNRDDGIEVLGGRNVISRNTANRNSDFGIEGEIGVIDGGGNKAFGNGNPLQCLNVVCK
jgi:parallel beta-helix repeat protein